MPKRSQRLKKATEESGPTAPTLWDFLPDDHRHLGQRETKTVEENDDSTNIGQHDESLEKPRIDYHIMRTKKGGLPVSCESRSSGKKVTLIGNVQGDAKPLLQDMKAKLGTGGILCENGEIELQGDLVQRVERYLREHCKGIMIPYKKSK